MKKLAAAIFTLLMMTLIGCSSISVSSDYDPEYDFASFKTFRWVVDKEINPNNELAKHPLIYKRVKDAVTKNLESKGMKLLESGVADVVISAHAGTKERIQVHQTGGYYRGWYDPYWGPYGSSTHVSQYEEGTLVIDIIHWKNKELAWRGMGTQILREYKDQERITEEVNIWVDKILAKYPPK